MSPSRAAIAGSRSRCFEGTWLVQIIELLLSRKHRQGRKTSITKIDCYTFLVKWSLIANKMLQVTSIKAYSLNLLEEEMFYFYINWNNPSFTVDIISEPVLFICQTSMWLDVWKIISKNDSAEDSPCKSIFQLIGHVGPWGGWLLQNFLPYRDPWLWNLRAKIIPLTLQLTTGKVTKIFTFEANLYEIVQIWPKSCYLVKKRWSN